MLILVMVKNLIKLKFNFVGVTFSPTLTIFIFLTILKINIKFSKLLSKVVDRSRGRPEGSLFNSYYTEV